MGSCSHPALTLIMASHARTPGIAVAKLITFLNYPCGEEGGTSVLLSSFAPLLVLIGNQKEKKIETISKLNKPKIHALLSK